MIEHPVVSFIITIGAVAGALTGIAVFVERFWRPFRTTLQKVVTAPITDQLNARMDTLAEQVDELKLITVHHLGPNGDTPQLHVRVLELRERVDELAARVQPAEEAG